MTKVIQFDDLHVCEYFIFTPENKRARGVRNLQAGVSGTQAQQNELDNNHHGQNRKKRSYSKRFNNESKESLMYCTMYYT